MFWLTIGIFVGIYLDQTFTIPPLKEYYNTIRKALSEKNLKE
jgi:hypothetical protein